MSKTLAGIVFALVLLFAGAVTATGGVDAKEFRIGIEKPVASVAFPDSWDVDHYGYGVSSFSPDKSTYVAVNVIEGKNRRDADKEMNSYFSMQLVNRKPKTKRERETILNGMKAHEISWDATVPDDPSHVTATLVKISDSKFVFFTHWSTGGEEGETTSLSALAAIAKSLTPIK